ncbi:MAG TPA: MBL fold metallo-hydrolase [Chloroflexota bacterium]|nr:MBL fold metallo-hydrolase [Chloroflexota bacterium]
MAARVELKSFSVGSFDNNVYILVDPAVGTSVLFDAPTDAERILRELDGTRLAAILMTHTDPDHVQALDEVRRTTGAPVGVHADDADRLPVKPDFFISDGESLEYGGIHLRALHTPGHTPGSLCFVTDGILIAGDTLFPGGPGNTRGDPARFKQIIAGIREKLFTLPDETTVYPGHGNSTTIGAERPHLQEWIDRGW